MPVRQSILFLLSIGEILLRDADSYWQIKVGQWIIDHGAMPHTDIYSFTRFGEPWISSSWLSQVLYAVAYRGADWAGPVILASIAIGATVAIFIYLLSAYADPARAILLATLALLQSAHHLFARPHVLALPVMLAFVGGLMAAADRRSHPSWLLLPLMALWADLHGGFVLGLALIGPIGLEAIWCLERKYRFALAAAMGVVRTSRRRGDLLYALRPEHAAGRDENSGVWASCCRSSRNGCPPISASSPSSRPRRLGLIGIAFYRRLELSVPRIILLLGLIWMAPTHVRNIEAFAFLVPLVLAKPVAQQWGTAKTATPRFEEVRTSPYVTILSAITIAVVGWASTASFVAHHPFSFLRGQTPVAAVDFLEQRKPQRIFHTAGFGSYMISRDIKVFIDGRAELYGEQFVLDYFDATGARNLGELLGTLDRYQIDATLLNADLRCRPRAGSPQRLEARLRG